MTLPAYHLEDDQWRCPVIPFPKPYSGTAHMRSFTSPWPSETSGHAESTWPTETPDAPSAELLALLLGGLIVALLSDSAYSLEGRRRLKGTVAREAERMRDIEEEVTRVRRYGMAAVVSGSILAVSTAMLVYWYVFRISPINPICTLYSIAIGLAWTTTALFGMLRRRQRDEAGS